MYHCITARPACLQPPAPGNSSYPSLGPAFGMTTPSLSGPQFVRLADADAVGAEAARIIADQLRKKPDSTIVFPTGKTPIPMYKALRDIPNVPWSRSRLFQLDEYVNPGHSAPVYETFARFIDEHLWGHVDGRKFYIRDYGHDPAAYERALAEAGGPDLVILGIGGNGHIAFNEPGSSPDSLTRQIPLAEATLRSNFGPDAGRPGYPTAAITMGLRTILGAKRILLLATGAGKQGIVKRVFDADKPPSLDLPASWLKNHPNVTVITDFEV